jgi:hypothetical protein
MNEDQEENVGENRLSYQRGDFSMSHEKIRKGQVNKCKTLRRMREKLKKST